MELLALSMDCHLQFAADRSYRNRTVASAFWQRAARPDRPGRYAEIECEIDGNRKLLDDKCYHHFRLWPRIRIFMYFI